MVSMVGVSTCTPNLRNVCLGSESDLMELDHLCLAEYYASSDATYPTIFGGRVSPPSQVSQDPVVVDAADSAKFESLANASSRSTNSYDISRSCYDMLEKLVLLFLF